jgi:predicted transcriptional regulator
VLNQYQFEKEVRKALIDRDMTAGDLAEELKISQAYLCDILKGSRSGTQQKEKIIRILGIHEN